MLTRWGYEVDADVLDPILTLDEFDAMGGSELSATDDAKTATIAAASDAIRDYCGWHITPVLTCTFDVLADGSSTIPVMGVDGSTVTLGDEEWQDGYMTSYGVYIRKPIKLQTLTCSAGIESDALKQVCYQLVTNHLVATAGLREEHIGTAGATYNQTDNGVSGGVRLLDSDRALLDPYRLVGVE